MTLVNPPLAMLNALSIDVEDYFHVTAFERSVERAEWDRYPLRVDVNTRRILAILDEYRCKGTFFILGWVAERLPELVMEIQRRGHEIACHGYGHELVYRLGAEKFRADIRKAKAILEDITGQPISGYRAPSYSITADSMWALDILVEEGFSYDSSIFPIHHDIYGVPDAPRFPHIIHTQSGDITEFPLTTWPLRFCKIKYRLPIAGGGYLRLLPAPLLRRGIEKINLQEQQPSVLYFHPWEIDPDQPRIRAGFRSRLRHYLNLHRTEKKVRYLLKTLKFGTMSDVLEGLNVS